MAHKNVLIVDDVAELGRMLQAALATLSDQLVVRVVPSAEEGLLEATRNPVDLMISDIRLAGISGLEFTRRVRLRHKTVKVIQISGMDDASLQQQSIEAGADIFFRKPLAMDDFLNAVSRLLELNKTAPLISPAEPASAVPLVLPNRLKEQISQLRLSLNSPAVGVLDDLGHILLQEGDLQGLLGGTHVLPAVMMALSAGANVPLTLGQTDTEIVMAFRGAKIDLMAVSLNATMALVIAFKHGPSRVATAIAFDEITRARLNILGFLREKGSLPVTRKHSGKTGALGVSKDGEVVQGQTGPGDSASPVNPKNEQNPDLGDSTGPSLLTFSPVVVPDGAVDQKLDIDLSIQEEAQKNLGENADAFWEEVVDRRPAASSPTRANTLTYEQARKMGLTPPDADKPKDGNS